MDILNRVYALDVCCFEDRALFEHWYEEMDPSRKQKIDRFKHDKDKLLSLGAGVLLKEILKKAGIDEFSLEYAGREKPYIKGRDDIFFNMSHSGNMAVLAISDEEVGVDIEKNKEFSDSLLNYVFDEEEIGYVDTKAPGADAFYTRLWTAKESVMKYYGKGISLEPKKIHLIPSGEKPSGMRLRCSEEGSDSLYLISYEIPGYQLTVCSQKESFGELIIAGAPSGDSTQSAWPAI